jgi:hypothetical protein
MFRLLGQLVYFLGLFSFYGFKSNKICYFLLPFLLSAFIGSVKMFLMVDFVTLVLAVLRAGDGFRGPILTLSIGLGGFIRGFEIEPDELDPADPPEDP